MGTVNIIPATPEHAHFIGQNIRQADKEELWASGYITGLDAMLFGMKYGEGAMTGCDGDTPVVMWGVAWPTMIGNSALPWMVASAALDDHAWKFLRRCRKPLVALFANYAILSNYVDARNVRSIEWLKYMGFTVEEKAEPYGVLGLPFHKFTKIRES